MSTSVRFTVADLALFPHDEGNRYEIIDGDLHVSTQSHWRHQVVCNRVALCLGEWDPEGQAGISIPAPGVIFASDQAVAPDLVWISRERFGRVLQPDGKLHAAPDLIVEVLSPGRENEDRDRSLKRKLYSRQGVREYWIVDWREETIQVYRRQQAVLDLVATLISEDALVSPLLPGFTCPVREIFQIPATS